MPRIALKHAAFRHVARIFERGRSPQRGQGAAPLAGGYGGGAPRKFLRNMASYTTFGNKDRVLNLLLT